MTLNKLRFLKPGTKLIDSSDNELFMKIVSTSAPLKLVSLETGIVFSITEIPDTVKNLYVLSNSDLIFHLQQIENEQEKNNDSKKN